jgi:histidinol dehydrogenase/leucyl-tRNA synthetase/ATP-dependent DNA helicase RecG
MAASKDPVRGWLRWQTAREGLWHKLAPESQRMRHEPTRAEQLLWQRLRRRALGVRFRHQHVIDRFIVDFCALEPKLIVEVDGPIHGNQVEQDAARDAVLQAAGFRVLRFSNDAVENRIEGVIARIRKALNTAASAAKTET